MTDQADSAAGGDFSRIITLMEARRQNGPLVIEAQPAECAALAQRFGILSLANVVARLDLVAEGERLTARGTVDADVEQACVATGRPIRSHVRDDILVRFVPTAALEAEDEESEIELGSDDLDVIGYTHGQIDLGAMVADSIVLALPPFPRTKDADAWLRQHGVKSEEEAGAFGALAALRDSLKS